MTFPKKEFVIIRSTTFASATPGRSEEGFEIEGDRIGSVLTGADGTCSISYEDMDFQVEGRGEKRPDLRLTVLGPEDSDSDKPPVVLYSSKLLRVNSGKTESAMIRIATKHLLEAGISLPIDRPMEDSTDTTIENYRTKKAEETALRSGIKEVNRESENKLRQQNQRLRDGFKEAILPNKEVLNSMYNFVGESDKVETVQEAVLKKGAGDINLVIDTVDIHNSVPGKGIKINLILTEEDKDKLAAFQVQIDGKKYYRLPEPEIRKILFKREKDDGINAILFSDNPISKYCIQKSADEKCALVHTELKTEDELDHTHTEHTEDTTPTTTTTPPLAGISNTDIPVYLEKILGGKDAPPFHDEKNYKAERPDSGTIQENVDRFKLQKGPADTTAFYDFHSLQIAFEHVWQQLLDQTIVDLGEQIHNAQESTGRKGFLQTLNEQTGVMSVNNILPLLANAQIFFFEEVPTEISTAFDISFLEYDNLSSPNKAKLLELATDINKFESIGISHNRVQSSRGWWNTFFGGVGTITQQPVDYATQASVMREQGERMIDNVRINKPYSTNQLLKDLQERLLSKYEFTVFAANKDFHSINFGLMNTFRQKWEPISYQAGKLVKTIPLSPKEERKFSVKSTINSKITRKQAQKNNSSLHQEINTTSRAESEIVARAQDKSNFSMSVKLDYSKISSQVSFGKDAQKESSQTKKDFREAVIKAAQEFKEERTVEVDTEETYSSEYTESGTLVNPNDELSVTYLLYELQRRYRVSEQLYRVMPVVLVAQEVPSPDQITEAWIIAHDWILNRVLLDDSFRETLQHIAERSVGEDFAIRELRKNLRAQRTLVNQLQVEFSKLRRESENRYKALEDAIDNRIDTEHDKRMHRRFFWYWGHGAFGPGPVPNPAAPPDPEMAKAQELAASDAQKVAAEKVERMALSVQREVNALHQLTSEYNAVMKEHLDRLTQVRRLVTHIKENILYYMQAIWSMEPPDQRFMRLYKAKVPYFEAERFCLVQDEPVPEIEDLFAQFRVEGKRKHVGWLNGKIKGTQSGPEITYKQLVEVADLDTMLGFKGNYMIFPLKEHNALTELMAAPYIDEAFGAMDPDQLSNINLEEFSKYVCCLHREDPEKFEDLKPVLTHWLSKLLADPLRNGDEIIVPTDSLFIEMLPSDKSLLEDFKLKHREWDVYKVREEVRRMALENIRYAARLLNDQRGDPDTEKKVVLAGNIDPHLDVDDI